MKISIVIPAYNEERHLGECLDSIARQTTKPAEVIVVDNNSSDRTVKVVRKYPFVRLLTERKRGIVFARDRGFDAARGDIIGRIDADTILPDHWVDDVLEFYSRGAHDNSVLTGGGTPSNVWFPSAGSWVFANVVYPIEHLVLGHYPTYGSNMALPRHTWQTVRPYICRRNDIHEDVDIAIHLHELGYPIIFWRYLDAQVIIRRMRAGPRLLWRSARRWPRTLQVHRNKLWPLAALEAALLLPSSLIVIVLDSLARVMGKRPLPE